MPAVLGLALLALAIWIFRSRRRLRNRESLSEAGIIGEVVTIDVVDTESRVARVTVRGEIWSVESDHLLQVGDRVRVIAMNGLKLKVQQQKQG